MHGNSLRRPIQSCLAGHDCYPRSMPLPSQTSANRAHGRGRSALKQPQACGGGGPKQVQWGHWAGYRYCPIGMHPDYPYATLVLLSQPAREPDHGAEAAAHSPGWKKRGCPAGTAITGVTGCHRAPLVPRAAPSPSPSQLHAAQLGDGCSHQLELVP